MGHHLMPRLGQSKRWREVVSSIANGESVDLIAARTVHASEAALKAGTSDPHFHAVVSMLVSLPLAARSPEFSESASELGLDLPPDPDLLDLSIAVSSALDGRTADKSDFGEMAQLSLVESLTGAVEADLPSLFDPEPGAVRTALGRMAGGDRFATFAQDFFARLTHRVLDYYLAREMAAHVGHDARFATDAERRDFDAALARHCHEAATIVRDYSGGWYGKNIWQGDGPTPSNIQGYAGYAFTKIRNELRKRLDDG
ncbi:MAG: hypothetical protein AAFN27_14250 [Pseudomonadota bacterium]